MSTFGNVTFGSSAAGHNPNKDVEVASPREYSSLIYVRCATIVSHKRNVIRKSVYVDIQHNLSVSHIQRLMALAA